MIKSEGLHLKTTEMIFCKLCEGNKLIPSISWCNKKEVFALFREFDEFKAYLC